jgi:hypothetical protein
VTRPSAGLRFFGDSLPRPEYSHLISTDELSPTRTFRDDFIPTTDGNVRRSQLSTIN